MPVKLRAPYWDENSIAFQLRKKRFAFFLSLLNSIDSPMRILDVGGTTLFWKTMGFTSNSDVEITVLNLTVRESNLPYFKSVAGNACQMQFGDGEFDIVFSNSVIEHVGEYKDQLKMAQEVKRVSKRYFIQTPNKYFPIEPHALFPFYQFLPISTKIWLRMHLRLGYAKKKQDYATARRKAMSVRLLSKRELMQLFPEAALYQERFCGLVKSFVAYYGWK